jgi:hypothetical protein
MRHLTPTYKPREWTKRSRKQRQKGTSQELAPIRHERDIETDINKKLFSNDFPVTNAHYHAIKL